MTKLIKLQILLIAVITLLFLGCSEGDKSPTSVTYISGEFSIFNEAEVPIRLLEYTQTRGDLRNESVINRRVNPGYSYSLINQIDGGTSNRFPARDMIIVHFIADVPNPHDPDMPLFENTIDRSINGNTTIFVKSGGELSASPG